MGCVYMSTFGLSFVGRLSISECPLLEVSLICSLGNFGMPASNIFKIAKFTFIYYKKV